MKKYSAEDIKTLEWGPLVRKRPEMYFANAEVTPEEISESIGHSARILGAKETKLIKCGDWSYFCSDIDWLFLSEYHIDSVEQVFQRPCPFPELNRVNSFRLEALCLPFSTDVFTLASGDLVVLKGKETPTSLINELPDSLGDWGRIVGFKFDTNA